LDLSAQNLEKLDATKPIAISGGVGVNLGAYTAFGAASRRDPFQWLLQANLTFNILNVISVPFSANFSQQNQGFAQPFNQYGASPRYKWLTGHFGYRNVTFSQFGMAGHTFLGAGLEATPGKWRLGICYGRLRQAVEGADAIESNVPVNFRRMGFATKIGFGDDGNFIDFSLLQASDDPNSIDDPQLISDATGQNVSPEQNLVLSLAGRKKLGKRLAFNAEFARSALTRDMRSPSVKAGTLYDGLGGFFTPRTSTLYRSAFQGGMAYTGSKYSAALDYKRIAPDYASLGTYFFNNDIEEITAKLGTTLFAGKVSVNGAGGMQRNNLAKELATNSSRIIGSANLSFTPSPTWNLALSGNNFSSTLKVQHNVLTDSLNFYQVTQNYGLNLSRILGNSDIRHTLNAGFNYQIANSRKEYSVDFEDETDFYNLTLGYNLNNKPMGIRAGLTLTSGLNLMPENTMVNAGPILNASKSWKEKKITLTGSLGYLLVFLNGERNSGVLNNRLKLDLNLWEHHGLGFASSLLSRSRGITTPGLTEYQFNVAYNFHF
jgi:hypothetical protein